MARRRVEGLVGEESAVPRAGVRVDAPCAAVDHHGGAPARRHRPEEAGLRMYRARPDGAGHARRSDQEAQPIRRRPMRVMVIVKATRNSEAGIMPSEKLLTEMGKFNEELVKAGVMLAGDGLHPSKRGKRVRFAGGKKTVIDGPFAETKELIAGYWIWQVKSIEEA